MTHTPERWEADESGMYIFAYDTAGRSYVAVEIRGWGMLSHKFGEEKAIEIQRERAHLVSASPEMLEALEEVVTITENLPVCPFCGAVKTVQSHSTDCLSHEIEAAIRKARGEE